MSLIIAVAMLLLMALWPSVLLSQSCPPASAFPGRPYFDFQVDEPARYTGRDSAHIRPMAQRVSQPFPPDFALAQFVVDSIGASVPGTLKMLVLPTELSKDDVMLALTSWRFEPALLSKCRVPQLVQTPLRWK